MRNVSSVPAVHAGNVHSSSIISNELCQVLRWKVCCAQCQHGMRAVQRRHLFQRAGSFAVCAVCRGVLHCIHREDSVCCVRGRDVCCRQGKDAVRCVRPRNVFRICSQHAVPELHAGKVRSILWQHGMLHLLLSFIDAVPCWILPIRVRMPGMPCRDIFGCSGGNEQRHVHCMRCGDVLGAGWQHWVQALQRRNLCRGSWKLCVQHVWRRMVCSKRGEHSMPEMLWGPDGTCYLLQSLSGWFQEIKQC